MFTFAGKNRRIIHIASGTQIETLIAGRYAPDLAQPLADAGGGMPAFACRDTRASGPALMALRVQPDRPPRADALAGLIGQTVAGVLLPLAHGALGDAYYVVCLAPSVPPLATGRNAPRQAWTEREVMEALLRPVAQTLRDLGARGLTHRAINLGNLFRAVGAGGGADGGAGGRGGGAPVMLGAAWAAPPASLQPSIYETPYVAQCEPAGRGNGSIADDVYSLGVVMLTLATGRHPMAGMDDAAVLRHKLDVGSFQALVGDDRPSAAIADLARGMLAEDPAHRPTPEMLIDPAIARSRRVAARPPRRAARPLMIGKANVANARGLASALAQDSKLGIAVLRGGQVEHWLRRSLNDAALASLVEDATRLRTSQDERDARADAILLARTVALLDPLAPLCWHGLSLWPDGIGSALAGARGDSGATARLVDLIDAEFIGPWAAIRAGATEVMGEDAAIGAEEDYLRREARRIRAIADGSGRRSRADPSDDGIIRLRYQLNPLLPCASPLLGGKWVADLPSLLPALEIAAGGVEPSQGIPYDREIAAFVAARTNRRDERDATAIFPADQPNALARTQMWLYAQLQSRLHPTTKMPNLARWLVAHATPLVENWRNRLRRDAIEKHLRDHAQNGLLVPLLAVLEDPETMADDQHKAAAALANVARIDTMLRDITLGGAARAELARRMGQELAAGAGLAGLAGVLTALAWG